MRSPVACTNASKSSAAGGAGPTAASAMVSWMVVTPWEMPPAPEALQVGTQQWSRVLRGRPLGDTAAAEGDLATDGAGREQRAEEGRGAGRQQPPQLRRQCRHPVGRSATDRVPRQ